MCPSGAERHGCQGEEGKGNTHTEVQRDRHGWRLDSQSDGHAAGLSANEQVREHDCDHGRGGERGRGRRQTAGHLGTDPEQDLLVCTHHSTRE